MNNRGSFWHRSGDFYNVCHHTQRWTRDVSFIYHTGTTVPVKSVYVQFGPYLAIRLKVLLFDYPVLSRLIRQFFPDADNEGFSSYRGGCSISIYCYRQKDGKMDMDFLARFKQFIDKNALLKTQFTEDILDEIESIINFINTNSHSAGHNIMTNPELLSLHHYSPLRRGQRLVQYVNALTDKKIPVTSNDIKAIHYYLARGESASQCNSAGHSVLTLLCVLDETETLYSALKLLLNYGANFKEADPFNGLLPLEVAASSRQAGIVNFFISTEIKVIPPIPESLKLFTADTFAGWQKVFSIFRFPQGELHTTLKLMQDLTADEREGVYQLYRRLLDGEEGIEATFSPRENKFINLVRRENGQIVGFVIYVLKFSGKNLWCNVDLELYDDCPNYGIMPAITYSFPFSLQQLFPHLIIWVIFLGIHYASFRRIENQLAFPKYQLEGQIAEIADALLKQFGYQLQIHHEGVSISYATEIKPITVKREHQQQLPDLKEELYHAYRDNNGTVPASEIKKRGVIVAIPMSFEFFAYLHQMLARRGLNFYHTAAALSTNLPKSGLFPADNMLPEPQYYAAGPLFWQRNQVPVTRQFHNQLALNPAPRKALKPNL